jgi:transcriptional regulator with XRE-family HTH domain
MTLDEWLKREGLTEAAFAARVGVTHVTVHRWRRGLARPDWKHLDAIARETRGSVAPLDFLSAAASSEAA